MEKNKSVYVGETNSLHCSDGELVIHHGDVGNEQVLVINVEELYKDLPFIIEQVCKEQKKMQEMYLEMIKESLNKLSLCEQQVYITMQVRNITNQQEKPTNL